MPVNITPNMGLIEPVVGQEPGPTWASDLNASLGILDQHNHTPGQGVQIVTAGININTDLPFNGNNATNLNTVRFNNLSSTLPGSSPNLGCLYVASTDLYFNDVSGNVIQITKSGAINATSSGISSGTATASFVGGVLVVDSNVNTPANVQCGSVLFGNIVSGSKFATVNAPSALSADYSLTLPPTNTTGNTVFLTYDTSNNIGLATLNSIPGSYIQDGTITEGKLAPRPSNNPAAVGEIGMTAPFSYSYATNTSTVTIPGSSVTLTTTGRPVVVGLQVAPGGTPGYIYTNTVPGANDFRCYFNIERVVGPVTGVPTEILLGSYLSGYSEVSGSQFVIPVTAIMCLDTQVSGTPGTYTWELDTNLLSINEGIVFSNLVMVAYEL